ncbi:WG repeat-containing protein [Fulvivirga sp. M361]|uniref:WG repeat-containing protein n=1 Tax=Fulvivirga sp. M361 TaxID=2594266 RepID=UPI00117A18D0|nr:WG repeat-containing protein [Fulvivirga sp. M361]TRX51584.1 WG repeat-containing protein [Fulvivirga sp. M361]
MRILLFFLTLISSSTLFGQRTLVPYRIGDKWGLANFYEELVIEPKYEEVGLFSDQVSPTKTDKSLARVKWNGLYGYVNESGIEVIEPQYEKASGFNQGYALVEKDGKSFVINVHNEIANDSLYKAVELLPNYSVLMPLNVLPPVEMNSWKKIYHDLGCEKVLPIKGNTMGFLIKKNERWGVVQYGELWIPMEYDSIHPYADKSYVLYRNGKEGLCVRFRGGVPPTITATEYDEIKIVKRHGYSDQLYWYRKDDYWGFINSRYKFIEPKYRSLNLSKERNFLYEVTTKDGDFGYYLMSLDKEYFADKQKPKTDELRPYFSGAEIYADKYVQQILPGVDVSQLVEDMEGCIRSAMNSSAENKKELYTNFCLGQDVDISKMDRNQLSKLSKKYHADDIVVEKAINVSPKLISVCQHLDTTFTDLIEKYPDYPLSQIVKTFKADIINETSPALINSAMSHVFDDCDFDTGFYQKVVLLYKFYGLVYFHLVDKGMIESPLKK